MGFKEQIVWFTFKMGIIGGLVYIMVHHIHLKF